MEEETKAPEGKTQSRWFRNGYQTAMQDIARCLTQGGEEAVQEWIENNTTIRVEIDR